MTQTRTSGSTLKSTIVRAFDLAALMAMRACFRTLEHLAPDAGSRLALRLWCTPPRRRGPTVLPPDNNPQPGGGTTFTGPHDGATFEVAVNGGRVLARAWGSGPAVYLLHGWGGWAGQLHGFVAPLVVAGYRVVAFDAPSHGRSGPGRLGPRRATIIEFSDALSAVVRACGPVHAIVAHSLGAAATGLAVLDGLPADRLTFISPVADPLPHTVRFRRTLGIGEAVGGRFLRRMEVLIGRSTTELNIAGRARQIGGLPPLLIVHDSADREVKPDGAAALAAAWPGRFESTTGLGHRRILRDPHVIEEVVRFITDPSPVEARGRAAHQGGAPVGPSWVLAQEV